MWFSLFIFTKNAQAKVLPQAQRSGLTTTIRNSGGGIGISAWLRGDRKALIINFTNLQNVTAVSYLLTYKTSTQDEGVQGVLNLSGAGSTTTELLFGTCSKNVCRYHIGIKDAHLEVTYTTKAGKKYIKRFRIRV